MVKVSMPDTNKKTHTVVYQHLRGADFSVSPSLADNSHSPHCLNMIADSGKNPVKRPGWETLYNLSRKVHNIWFCTLKGKKYTLCHCGTTLYSLKEPPFC